MWEDIRTIVYRTYKELATIATKSKLLELIGEYVFTKVITFLTLLMRGKFVFQPRRRIFQPAWEQLYRLSLEGMNVGGSPNVCDSGEVWVIDHIGQCLSDRERIIVFDVGANIGGYGSEAICRLGKKVILYCFEPSKKTFQLLTSNLGKYQNVKLFNFGFSNREKSATLYSNAEGSGLASLYDRHLDYFGISMEYTEEVCLRTLDDFCQDKEITWIGFLKVDVEGHELKMLQGAGNLIRSNSIDFIQFEFGGTDIDSRTFFKDFFRLLNPYYRILDDGLRFIEHYEEIHELFVPTNFLAISRKM